MLASFYYGYVVNQMSGGYMAEKLVTKHVMLASISMSTFFTLLGPTLARAGYVYFCVGRALQGFFESPVWPCIYVTAAAWLPKEEKTFLFACMMSGKAYRTDK